MDLNITRLEAKKYILLTGIAGFIGFHVCKLLIKSGYNVIGIDNINDYYDINLKYDRLKQLGINDKNIINSELIYTSSIFEGNLLFQKIDLNENEKLEKIFKNYKVDIVCNLAAQAGVRYSIENPHLYISSNINGFINLLEHSKNYGVKRFVYSSSSSVYGNDSKIPFAENQVQSRPVSVYAATKQSNELLAHVYSSLFNLETIGLRLFTVYGPWGRPDMALFLFTKAIIENKPIKVFNKGNLQRDFSYIDDVAIAINNVICKDSKNKNPFKIYNIGNSNPVKLMDFILLIEKKLNKTSKKIMLEMQPGDVNSTYADVSKLKFDYDFSSNTSIEKGVSKFIDWYLNFYKIKL